MQSSYDLLRALKNMGYLKTARDPLWWPHSGTFEVIIGAILTQQTKWEKVEASLANLKEGGLISMEALSQAHVEQIATRIKPSGFYNTKSKRLQLLCQNILSDFHTFERFQNEVTREWLLEQKGIGMESADSILCYGCGREVFVVDSYTARLLDACGYHFESYMELQEWMQEGIEANFDKITRMYSSEVTLHTLYARFHGMIVEFAKEHIRGKDVDTVILEKYIEG
ncbi:3-methyladenine DNA glycosylase [Sulfurovum sp. XGS-02]|uniref:3-methyladenine DNA glycosylase n=1 Tax=Sulfurovum sp. XGS-02 TaxID=2925411 RepID=UPI002054BC52|nr:3-methyladenine DNA glycosylase [Sulfurovum sp. XGS-02]UPT78527.1 3-methyladenine DNA glycosylase [Sulfurovum sp. XGS-02]